MRAQKFLFLIIIISLILSGCLREYGSVAIISVDVMTSSQQDDGTKLTITPYIRNNLDTGTGILTVKVKIKDPSTNLIVADKDSDIGYIKSQSQAYNSVSLLIVNPGDYIIEVQVFEEGRLLDQYSAPVKVKAAPLHAQPAEIKLMDMKLVITKFVNDASSAVVEVSPGVYNQGGDSKPLTIQVTARIDPYTAYTESDEIGIVKSTNQVRGKVSYVLPRNREYSFTMSVIEDRKIVASAKVDEKIDLNKIKYNTPMTFVLVEEGKPKPKEPGFEVGIALIGILLYVIYKRTKNKGEKNEQ